jgi:hypothetical protein
VDTYKEQVKGVFPDRVEVGTMPGAGDSTYIVVGFTLDDGFKACFALTTLEAGSLAMQLAEQVEDLSRG